MEGACSREGTETCPKNGESTPMGQDNSPRGATVRKGRPALRDRFLAEANLSHELADAMESLCGFAFLPSKIDDILWRWRHP
jgi:hypothetical protein